MSLKYIGNDPVNYNGQEINVLRHFAGDNDERIEFEYKGNDIYLFFNRENYIYYCMVSRICKIIDRLGRV